VVKREALKWPVAFLPGENAPEQILIDIGADEHEFLAGLAGELGVTEAVIRMALGHVAGVDHHDYFREFANVARPDVANVLRGFVRVWLRDPANEVTAVNFIKAIREATGLE
jgi:hypothetical protein